MEVEKYKKTFHFTNETDLVFLSCSSSEGNEESDCDKHICDHQCLNVIISEVLDPNYGMYVWPCAPILAQYIWFNKEILKGKTVLELGAGTALPSVVAAKCGATVIVTDGKNLPQTLQCSEHNLELNHVSRNNYSTIELPWGTFCPNLLNLNHIDIILGSDVFYEPSDFEDVIVTVAYIMREKNKEAAFWCTYEERSFDWTIEHLLCRWNLNAQELPLEDFGVTTTNLMAWNISIHKNIKMLVIRYTSRMEN